MTTQKLINLITELLETELDTKVAILSTRFLDYSVQVFIGVPYSVYEFIVIDEDTVDFLV